MSQRSQNFALSDPPGEGSALHEDVAPLTAARRSLPSAGGPLAWPQVWVAALSLAAIGALGMTILFPHLGAGFFIPALGVVVALIAAFTDSLTARIPNKLTYPAILLGLSLNAVMSLAMAQELGAAARFLYGPGGYDALVGFAVCAAIGIASMAVGGIHGGDMKLIAALGAIFGLQATGVMLLWALVVAIPLAIVNLVADGKLISFFRAAAYQAYTWLVARSNIDVMVVSRRRIPIAVPLAAGVLLGLLVPASVLPPWLIGG